LWAGPLKDNNDRLGQIFLQAESVLIVGLFTLIGTIVVYYISSILTKGSRVNSEIEEMGLDEAIHGEKVMNL